MKGRRLRRNFSRRLVVIVIIVDTKESAGLMLRKATLTFDQIKLCAIRQPALSLSCYDYLPNKLRNMLQLASRGPLANEHWKIVVWQITKSKYWEKSKLQLAGDRK